MNGWKFKVRGFAGPSHPRGAPVGTLLLETVHKGEPSAAMEIEAWQTRMCDGSASRAELIDMRPGGNLTNLQIYADTEIAWSWKAPKP
jgi:hypothetical protein